jgi:hypothetical protein
MQIVIRILYGIYHHNNPISYKAQIRISGVMVSVLASSTVDRGLESRSNQRL